LLQLNIQPGIKLQVSVAIFSKEGLREQQKSCKSFFIKLAMSTTSLKMKEEKIVMWKNLASINKQKKEPCLLI
jgi:hypothetical protein